LPVVQIGGDRQDKLLTAATSEFPPALGEL
jgi:hypothetical protein